MAWDGGGEEGVIGLFQFYSATQPKFYCKR